MGTTSDPLPDQPQESEVAKSWRVDKPTWGDLKLMYFTLLKHCQRFIPEMPNRYYARLSDQEKSKPYWASHFTTMIQMATPEESKAPDILIENKVNPEVQPCPPFEFLWTNSLILGKGVPVSPEQTEGCECEGPCNPLSTTCWCIKRQRKYLNGDLPRGGFLYEKNGTLKEHEFPIFECNENCDCSAKCSNRVSSLFYHFQIRSTIDTDLN